MYLSQITRKHGPIWSCSLAEPEALRLLQKYNSDIMAHEHTWSYCGCSCRRGRPAADRWTWYEKSDTIAPPLHWRRIQDFCPRLRDTAFLLTQPIIRHSVPHSSIHTHFAGKRKLFPSLSLSLLPRVTDVDVWLVCRLFSEGRRERERGQVTHVVVFGRRTRKSVETRRLR